MKKIDRKIVSLHRHWLHADAIRELIGNKKYNSKGLPRKIRKLSLDLTSMLKLEIYYALLYVVIEGYQEIKGNDEKLNQLIDNKEFVDALRLFRNGLFHYQKEPIPEKILKFLELKESETWIRDLNKSFKAYFERELEIELMLKKILHFKGKELKKAINKLFSGQYKHLKS